MSYQFKKESKPSSESIGAYQNFIGDFSESQVEQVNRDSLPKYYPKDHEVTRWLVNQMRCRNGLHHLVNLANVQPSLLSAYFELNDQPHLYIDARTGPGMPAYSIKTVLYLTPLAIAIYFRLRSVLRLLLDTSGTRIHARARQEIDVNATCYVRRTIPRPGPFLMDEYSTTYPAIIAVRREFFAGLSLLMAANFHPQAPIGIIERLGTPRETTHWFVDLLDFCVKLLNVRPGIDINGVLQTISYRTIRYDNYDAQPCYYDPCVYDVKSMILEPNKDPTTTKEIWFSVFRRLARKGASRNYSNCGNRLIGLLEHISSIGFFKQKYMPKGLIEYDLDIVNYKCNRLIGTKKMNSNMINNLNGNEKELAIKCIGADRDICLCLLILWLERVRNRCLDRQAQRLFRLLTTSLADTELLNDFLFPPSNIDLNNTLHPYWLSIGLNKYPPKNHQHQYQTSQYTALPMDYFDDDGNEICELEPPQINEIRQEIGILSHAMGLIDYSEKLYNLGYPKLVDVMPLNGALGDAITITNESNLTGPHLDLYKDNGISISQNDPVEQQPQIQLQKQQQSIDVNEQDNKLNHINSHNNKYKINQNKIFWTNSNRLSSSSLSTVQSSNNFNLQTNNITINDNLKESNQSHYNHSTNASNTHTTGTSTNTTTKTSINNKLFNNSNTIINECKSNLTNNQNNGTLNNNDHNNKKLISKCVCTKKFPSRRHHFMEKSLLTTNHNNNNNTFRIKYMEKSKKTPKGLLIR